MESTGIVRRLDSLGRIVIPVELRRVFGIEAGSGVEVYLEGKSIVLAKYQEGCCFCGGTQGLERFRGKWLCRECLRAMAADR